MTPMTAAMLSEVIAGMAEIALEGVALTSVPGGGSFEVLYCTDQRFRISVQEVRSRPALDADIVYHCCTHCSHGDDFLSTRAHGHPCFHGCNDAAKVVLT